MEAGTVERSFDCLMASVRRVRQFVGDVLRSWRIGAPADDVLLIADELATNAVVHARSDFVVRLHRRTSSIRVEVEDSSVALPTVRSSSPLATGGRGLVLVNALAEAWGWDVRDGGKSVWVEISTSVT